MPYTPKTSAPPKHNKPLIIHTLFRTIPQRTTGTKVLSPAFFPHPTPLPVPRSHQPASSPCTPVNSCHCLIPHLSTRLICSAIYTAPVAESEKCCRSRQGLWLDPGQRAAPASQSSFSSSGDYVCDEIVCL